MQKSFNRNILYLQWGYIVALIAPIAILAIAIVISCINSARMKKELGGGGAGKTFGDEEKNKKKQKSVSISATEQDANNKENEAQKNNKETADENKPIKNNATIGLPALMGLGK